MEQSRQRRGVHLLTAVGITGLAAEILWIRFGILSGFLSRATWDIALGEIAVTGLIYGLILSLAVAAYLRPDWAFRPPVRHVETSRLRWLRAHFKEFYFLWIGFVVFLEFRFLATGMSTLAWTLHGLLHFYPIAGLMGAVVLWSPAAATRPEATRTG